MAYMYAFSQYIDSINLYWRKLFLYIPCPSPTFIVREIEQKILSIL